MTTLPVHSPSSVDEAAEFLSNAVSEGRAVRFVGSGSRLDLGTVEPCDVVMDSRSMTSVIDWLVEDLTVVVEAGMRVGDLEQLLASENQTSLLPTSEPERTIGGLIAEGASGFERLKYGPTRDRTLEVTLATGYGKVVRGGGRLVKNVTGYDLPRLATGSLGSLGFIGSVCLKLWPIPPQRTTVAVADPAAVYAETFRPAAVLETESGSLAMIEGSVSDVAALVESVALAPEPMNAPEALESQCVISVRVRPSDLGATLDSVKALEPDRFTAQHGVGVIDVGLSTADPARVADLRTEVEGIGGSVVVVRPGDSLAGLDPWGTPPTTIAIQRCLKELFDPSRVCNPGILPGGI